MKKLTICLLFLSLIGIPSCDEDNLPTEDESLAGSISYYFGHVRSNLYLNGEPIELPMYSDLHITKIDDDHVDFWYYLMEYQTYKVIYGLSIRNLRVYGKPYDVRFDYSAEYPDNASFVLDGVWHDPFSIKVEGSLRSPRADSYDKSIIMTRDDWSPPFYTGDFKATFILDDDEYIVEIYQM